jgi:hypothetical protein
MSARAELANRLLLDSSAPTKTFVLEVHTAEPATYLAELFGSDQIEATSDGYLHRALLGGGEMWVDRLDQRFWSFHTDMPAHIVRRFLRERVEARRDLDWMWLPSEHLRSLSRHAPARRVRTEFSGQDLLGPGAPGSGLKIQAIGTQADKLLDYLAESEEYRASISLQALQIALEDDGGTLNEGLDRMGVFAAYGGTLATHLQFVRTVVSRYAAFVEVLERRAIGWDPLDPDEDGGGLLTGGPVGIHFSQAVPDLARFVDELFSARQPFRLWGEPVIEEGVAEIDAVDLHIGQRVRMDIGDTWMRVYLERGSCGNTVARLLSNLQHRFDSRLSLTDPELQRALTANNAVLGSTVN